MLPPSPTGPSCFAKHPVDRLRHKECRFIGCGFLKLKQFRRLAARYEKTARTGVRVETSGGPRQLGSAERGGYRPRQAERVMLCWQAVVGDRWRAVPPSSLSTKRRVDSACWSIKSVYGSFSPAPAPLTLSQVRGVGRRMRCGRPAIRTLIIPGYQVPKPAAGSGIGRPGVRKRKSSSRKTWLRLLAGRADPRGSPAPAPAPAGAQRVSTGSVIPTAIRRGRQADARPFSPPGEAAISEPRSVDPPIRRPASR